MVGSPANERGQLLRWALGGLSCLLMAYAVLRACTISFSWDEAFTYLNHVRWDVLMIREHDMSSANHHLLNVWGMWVCAKLFGTHELSLRLPNLLALALYLYAAVRMSLRAGNTVLGLCAFVLFVAHPYLIDFFSLARGYGLSNGFMLLSLWQLYRFATEGASPRFGVLSAVYAALSALAHTILLNFFLCILAVVIGTWLLEAWRKRRRPRMAPIFLLVGIAALCLSLVVSNAVGMYANQALFHGSAGPWEGMMGSLAGALSYHHATPLAPLTIMAVHLFIMATTCAAALTGRARVGVNTLPIIMGLLLVAGIMLALFLQHALMDLPWPQTRTALFLVPLLCWLLVSALYALSAHDWLARAVGVAVAGVLLIHFVRCANTTYALEWVESGEVKDFIEEIQRDHSALDGLRPVVSVSCGPQCSPAMNYTIRAYGLQWLVSTDQPKQDSLPRSEYHLVAWDAERWVEPEHWTLLRRSMKTGTALYRDERMHRPFHEVVHEQVLPAAYADTIVRDGIPEPRLNWAVPPDQGPGLVLVTGTAQALETGHESWLSLSMDHVRNGRIIDHADIASHHQVRQYGLWYQAGILFQPKNSLSPGDTISFTVIPYIREPRIRIGNVSLRVLR